MSGREVRERMGVDVGEEEKGRRKGEGEREIELSPGSLIRVAVLDHFSFEDAADPREELERPILLEYVGFLETVSDRYLLLIYGRTIEGRKKRSEGIALLRSAVVELEVLRPPGGEGGEG